MLVHKKEFSVQLTKPSGDTQVVTWEKFVGIVVPRVSYSAAAVEKFLNAVKEIEAGTVVDGADINLKGWKVERTTG